MAIKIFTFPQKMQPFTLFLFATLEVSIALGGGPNYCSWYGVAPFCGNGDAFDCSTTALYHYKAATAGSFLDSKIQGCI